VKATVSSLTTFQQVDYYNESECQAKF
jgi:hypothetical protein